MINLGRDSWQKGGDDGGDPSKGERVSGFQNLPMGRRRASRDDFIFQPLLMGWRDGQKMVGLILQGD